MEPVAHVDFETRSTVELTKCGVHKYAVHPDTGVWCMAWAIGDDEPEIWRPGLPFPVKLKEHILAGRVMFAHNASFERDLWRHCCIDRYGFPPVDDSQWHCTAAMAAVMSLPRSLGECASVLGLAEQKDKEGYGLMMRMARPRSYTKEGMPVWWDVPERRARLEEYCRQDVRTERAIEKRLRPLSDRERNVYLMDMRMNETGIPVDRNMARNCAAIIEQAQLTVDDSIRTLTDDEVTAVTQTGALRKWLAANGVETESVDKATVANLLEEGDLPGAVRAVLLARQEAGRSSVAKIRSILDYADEDDDRMRGLFLYHGASTGRWSGKGPQPQNLPRGEIEITAPLLNALRTGTLKDVMEFAPPFSAVSSAVRQIIRAPIGHQLFAGDFSAIEARVLAWCAGEETALEHYRMGVDRYKIMASKIYGVGEDEVTKAQRQLGKAAVLGCGFGMGAEKFAETAGKAYGVVVDDRMAQNAIMLYRHENPKTVRWWGSLERAAIAAVRTPGKVTTAGTVKYAMQGSYLWCLLPSGRQLCYPKATIETDVSDRGYERQTLCAMGTNSRTRKWGTNRLWRGLLAENVVQAAARDVLVDAMLRLENNGYQIIMTVHDEIVCQANMGDNLDHFRADLIHTPQWATGLPIDAEVWAGERYRK